jgi:hypothetical protein
MGHLKMLINELSQDIPLIGFLHSFDVLPHHSKDIFFFFVDDFDLMHLCLWFSFSGFTSHSFPTILPDVPGLLAIVAHLLLPFIIEGFCDIHIHMILRMDITVVPLLIDQL